MIPQAKLYLFDLDGCLSEFKTGKILENVKETIAQLPSDAKACVVHNAGGVGLGHWMREEGFGTPQKYPTEKQAREHVAKVLAELGVNWPVYFSFAYQSVSKGNWSPVPPEEDTEDLRCWQKDWRKPNAGMLLQAITDAGFDFATEPKESFLMIGDRDEDSLAAAKIDIPFIWDYEFFNRAKADDGVKIPD